MRLPVASASLRHLLLSGLAVTSLAGVRLAQEDKVFANGDGSLRVVLTERMLGYPEPGMTSQTTLISPDGRSVAMTMMGGGVVYVVHNGVEGERFEGIAEDSVRFSPDGMRLAYIGVRDDRKFVVLDGVLKEQHSIGVAGVVFSPTGGRCSWVGGDPDGRQFTVIDGQEGERYEGITPLGVLFSPDESHYAYVVLKGKGHRVVTDGVEGERFTEILDLWWTPVGNKLGYVARRGDKRFVVFDGEIVAEVDGVGTDGFVFPARGERYAIAVQREGAWGMLVDGEIQGDYGAILLGPRFSDDGSRYGYIAGGAGRSVLVLDGVEQEVTAPVPFLAFSPSGDRMAIIQRQREQRRVEIDGELGPAFDKILPPGVIFSPDGQHTMYRAQRGDHKFVVYDGQEGPAHRQIGSCSPEFVAGNHLVYSYGKRGKRDTVVVDGVAGPTFERVFGPTFSVDGERWAYVGQREGRFHVLENGREVAQYDHAPGAPVFSPDGARMAYVAGRDGLMFVVVDGVEGTPFDHVAPPTLTFTPDGAHLIHVAANTDRRFIVVDDLVIDNEYEGFLRSGSILTEGDRRFFVRASRRSVWWLVTLEIL